MQRARRPKGAWTGRVGEAPRETAFAWKPAGIQKALARGVLWKADVHRQLTAIAFMELEAMVSCIACERIMRETASWCKPVRWAGKELTHSRRDVSRN